MARGFVYLIAIVDWFTWRVLAWRVSISLDAEFCIETLEEALARYGKSTIVNSDQSSQFTSTDFTAVLHREKIAISMDGKSRWRDNVFVERLWRSVKYEEVYLNAYASVPEARAGIGRYIGFYNAVRPHSALGGRRLTKYISTSRFSQRHDHQRQSTYQNREPVQINQTTSYVASLMPCFRHGSAVFTPASCSRSMPMI